MVFILSYDLAVPDYRAENWGWAGARMNALVMPLLAGYFEVTDL